ncbi:MAG TPA: carbohydrate kinase family protein [Ktedonobacteraceae bacterium]|nr:carbohydrate kinase family protein [Ktedonobacteraceae bacterium]
MVATVLCFGNLQLDVLCRTVTALPPPGELHMIDTIDFALSGNGGNVAVALGRLGLEVELASYSGADIIAEQFRIILAAMGVSTDKLLRHPTASTGTSWNAPTRSKTWIPRQPAGWQEMPSGN